MFLCLRVDLDYVPWDTPDANEFGHGEPAMVLRLIELARKNGYKFHFFASERVVRALPSTVEAVLSEGHDLDWLCKHPGDIARWESASDLFLAVSHVPIGVATKASWPEETSWPDLNLKFLSAPGRYAPPGVKLFNTEAKGIREGTRSAGGFHSWAENSKQTLREAAARSRNSTLVVRPQVLAKVDPKLTTLHEVLRFGLAYGLTMRTLREALSNAP